MAEIRIGISGWNYVPWRRAFYPPGLPQRRELEYASRQVRTIEINGSFYSLCRPESYAKWYAATPADFCFAVKGSRFITHMKRLRDCEIPLANFLASGVLRLEDKLGPILWQLPPQMTFDAERLRSFLDLLPRDTGEALALAKQHDQRLEGRAWLAIERVRPMRYAFEVRHPSFETPELGAILREHGAAFVVADTAGRWIYAHDVTADFVYVRLHGAEELYASGYSEDELATWADRIESWHRGGAPEGPRIDPAHRPRRKTRDVYVYFDNDIEAHAPYDAIRLAEMLGYRPEGERRVRDASLVGPDTRPRPSWTRSLSR